MSNSRVISQKRIKERQALRRQHEDEKRFVYEVHKQHKMKVLEKHRKNLAKSPFQIDLVAEVSVFTRRRPAALPCDPGWQPPPARGVQEQQPGSSRLAGGTELGWCRFRLSGSMRR